MLEKLKPSNEILEDIKVIASSKSFQLFAAAVSAALLPSLAYAISVPNDHTAFGWTAYDLVVNEGLKGPLGFCLGVMGIVWSGSVIQADWKRAGLGLLGSSCILKADKITSTLGILTSQLTPHISSINIH